MLDDHRDRVLSVKSRKIHAAQPLLALGKEGFTIVEGSFKLRCGDCVDIESIFLESNYKQISANNKPTCDNCIRGLKADKVL